MAEIRSISMAKYTGSFVLIALGSLVLAGCGPGTPAANGSDDGMPSPSPSIAQREMSTEISEATMAMHEPESGTRAVHERAEVPFVGFELLATIEVSHVNINAIAFATDGFRFVTGGSTPKIWKLGSADPAYVFEDLFPFDGTLIEAESIAISSDRRWLALGAGNGVTYLIDFASHETKHELGSHELGVASVSLSDDGTRLVTSGYDGKAMVWDTTRAAPTGICQVQPEGRVRSMISPAGTFVVSAGKEAVVWSGETAERIGELDRGTRRDMGVWAVAISSDGQYVATGDATVDYENAAMVWSAEARQLKAILKHEFGVWHVAFSPDAHVLATGDVNGAVRLWRWDQEQVLQTIELEDVHTIDAIAWGLNGQILAVASDGLVRLWGPPGTLLSTDIVLEAGEATERDPAAPLESLAIPNEGPPASNQTEQRSVAVNPGIADDSPEIRQPLAGGANEIVSYSDVTPITVAEAIALCDLTQFPVPDQAAPTGYSRPTAAAFIIPDKFPTVVEKTLAAFQDLGWQVIEHQATSAESAAVYARHEQLLISCKLRQEQPSRTRMDIECLGNVDIRSLPKVAVKSVMMDYPDSVAYRSSSGLDEIIASYDQ